VGKRKVRARLSAPAGSPSGTREGEGGGVTSIFKVSTTVDINRTIESRHPTGDYDAGQHAIREDRKQAQDSRL